MKRKYLKLSALILSVSALTVLSSCETSARYIGSNTWEGTVTQIYHDPNEWYGLSNNDLDISTWWNTTNGLNGNKTKIYLTEDIHLTAECYAFWQNGGTDVTLCLNGYNIYGYEYNSDSTDGGAITIGKDGSSNPSTLRIEDCVGGGKITSCKADVGGAIKVNEGGNLYFNGGTIEGNEAVYKGGAIYNWEGYVEINGGTIKNNTAGQEGGGIYNDQGKLVINGGEISGNSADDGGGIYSDCDSTSDSQGLYINGGTITGNSATYDAGGVKFEHYVDTGTQDSEGEAIYQETASTLHLSGSPYIYDNYATQNNESIQYNVETDELSLLAFDGALTEGAKIGVTYSGKKAEQEPPYQISVGESSTSYTQGAVNYIVSDVEYYETKYNSTGNYLTLDGVEKFDTVATASITLIFDFVHSGDTTPLDSTSSSGKLILPTTEDGQDYARIFIEGDWDNYENEYDLTLDPVTESYYVTLPGLKINYHSFYIYVGYLDNDDHIPLSDDNPEFTFMVPLEVDSLADSEGIYTIEFNVESEYEFSDLVSEEKDKHKVSFTLQFKLWQGWGSSEQQPLEYGDLYVWTDMNDWSGWMKCYVQADGWDEDGNVTSSHYYLDVDNLEVGEYEYSLVIWYNDEEIPDPTEDESVWDRKVNSGDGGVNNIFNVTDAVLAENDDLGYIPINVDNTTDTLENLLPYRLRNVTLNLTFYSNDTSITSAPEYGDLYIAADWDTYYNDSDVLQWNCNKLEPQADGSYSFNFSYLNVGTYQYDILFVYSGDSPSWEHPIVQGNTLEVTRDDGDDKVFNVSFALGYEISDKYIEHGASLTSYTLRFTIWTNDNANQGRDYTSGTDWNVYICGTVPGSDNWASAQICLYNSHYSELYDQTVVSYDYMADGFYPGESYTYKLLYVNTTVTSFTQDIWNNPQITTDDVVTTIDADASNNGIQEIEIQTTMWFNNPWRN